eukprot:3144351-Pyramimonas_sp.AAC.1
MHGPPLRSAPPEGPWRCCDAHIPRGKQRGPIPRSNASGDSDAVKLFALRRPKEPQILARH